MFSGFREKMDDLTEADKRIVNNIVRRIQKLLEDATMLSMITGKITSAEFPLKSFNKNGRVRRAVMKRLREAGYAVEILQSKGILHIS